MTTHSQQHDLASQARCRTQLGRDQYPAGSVHVDILRITQQKTLQWTSRHWDSSNLIALFFPQRAGINKQTAIRVAGKGKTPLNLQNERGPTPGRNGPPN